MPFWKGKNAPTTSSWEPPTLNFDQPSNAKITFLLFVNIAYFIIFGPSWAPFGEVLGPQFDTFWWPKINQKIDQFLDRFFIDFDAILGPKMAPKWTRNFEYHWPWGCFLASWNPLGTPRCPKRVPEAPKASKSYLRDLIFDDFGIPFWVFYCLFWIFL